MHRVIAFANAKDGQGRRRVPVYFSQGLENVQAQPVGINIVEELFDVLVRQNWACPETARLHDCTTANLETLIYIKSRVLGSLGVLS